MKRIALAIAINIIADPISTEAYLQIRNVAVRFIPQASKAADRPSACVWTKFHTSKCAKVKFAGLDV